MKLNHDCVRKVMLSLEETLDNHNEIVFPGFAIEGFSDEETLYSVKKISEAGFISADVVTDINDETYATVTEITWDGHTFLDTIRDDTVWGHTKKLLSDFTSTSITFVSNVASQVLTNLITQRLNGKI